MSSRQLDEERIFHIARKIADTEAQTDYLEQICAGDQALRERVEALLDVHEKEQSFLQSKGNIEPTVDQSPITEGPGQQVGRYKLLQKIGEGGFGVVYMADQERPVRRKVALKIIKPGMDTHAVVARFEAERQALALMDHPNIARVLDGGATESGRSYFVMELVKGVPVTEYCDKNQLSTDDRLKLFVDVCQAVQHAHQKGIIHRDLKPSNILVTLHDGQPVIKVIDFGVAKATNQRLTERTLFTSYGEMIGTPQYMSPEQAEMSGLDVDTRSDIYSLGVVLYELLTGTTPLEAERLRTAGYAEMQRLIQDDEPPKPSTRLSSSGDQLTIIAKHRKLSPEQLQRTVRGDLDWIVMKALEKDRNRRYDSASDFCCDVRRFLSQETIEARPPSAVYHIQKFVVRNRGRVAVTAFILIAFTFGLVMSVSALIARAAALNRLRDELVDKAQLAVLSGDHIEARRAIEDARLAGMPAAWVEILSGQLELYSGNYKKGIEHLTEATRLDSTSIAARAMLAVAYDLSGQSDQHMKHLRKLPKVSECPPEDRVFLINALLHQDTSLAYEALRLLEPEHDSALARLIRADVEIHHVMDTDDIAVAESALRNIEVARMWMKGRRNEYVTGLDLAAHLVAIFVSDDADQVARLNAAAKHLAVKLAEDSQAFLSQSIASMYFRYCTNNSSRAFNILKKAVNNGATDYSLTEYASMLYEKGDYAESERILTDALTPENTPVAVALAGVLAWSSDENVDDLKQLYRQTRVANRKLCFWTPETILIFVNDDDFVREECRRVLDNLTDGPELAWNRTVVQFIAGDVDPGQLIEAADRSLRRKCTAHYLIAMTHLRKGHVAQAQHYLDILLKQKNLGYAPGWALAFRARLNRQPD